MEVAAGHEQADGEEQRVAGQDREEQAALDEHDDQSDDEELGAEALEEPRGSIQLGPSEAGRAAGSIVSTSAIT